MCLVLVSLFSLAKQNEPDQAAVEAAKKLVTSIRACPRREVVAQFLKKWVKEAWGPPENVTFDVEKSSSILYPCRITVGCSLTWSYGPERKSKEDAANDTVLRPMITGTNRNIYDFGKDDSA